MSSHRRGRQQARDLRPFNERINENLTLELAEFNDKKDKKKTTVTPLFLSKCTEDEVVDTAEDEDMDEVPLPSETEDEGSTSNDARWSEMCTEDEIKKDEKELELSIAAIMKNIFEGRPIDIQDFMKVTFMTLFGPFSHLNVKKIAKKVEKLEEKVDTIELSVDAIVTRVDNMQARVDASLDSIETKVENVKTKADDSLNSVETKFDSVKTKVENVKTKVDASLNSVETKFDDMETKLEHVDKKMINLEIENHAKNFILKKVRTKLAKDEKKENLKTTKSIVEEILNIAKMDLKSIDQVYRIYPNQNQKTTRKKQENEYPNIFLKFSSKNDIVSFTEKLNDIKKAGKFKKMQFEKYVPACLIDNWNKANLKAYNLRKEKSMITRTYIKNGEVELLAKSKKEDSFVKFDYDNITTKL